MQHQASLLVLAAGMGSRYGGLKQLDGFGPNGETIIDYSIYDAIQAGFTKIVFIIRKSFADEFKERFDKLWSHRIELHYVYQELNDLPAPHQSPLERTKPWGTGHAVWVARNVIHEPFGVINADDYYGRPAIVTLFDALTNGTVNEHRYAVIAYPMRYTLSDHGAVNRGVCTQDNEGYLQYVKECKGIQQTGEYAFYNEGNQEVKLSLNSLVSMNIWGFDFGYFKYAEDHFTQFLSNCSNPVTEEFFIPELIQHLIDAGEVRVAVLESRSQWYGVTYKEDKPAVQKAFNEMIQNNYYPANL